MTNADDNTYPPSPYGAPAPYGATAPYGAPAAYGAPPTSPYGYSATSPDSYPPPSSSPYGQTEYKMGTDVYSPSDVYTDHHHHHHGGNQTFVMRLVTPSSRNRFVAKVYAIVAFQLLLVSLVCAPVIYSQTVRDAVDINEGLGLGLYITAAILELVFLCALFCFRKKRGLNVLLLIGFTLCTGYIISVACSYVAFDEIVEAAVITFLIVVSVLGYCLFTKADFTFIIPFIFCVACLMLFWCLWSMWFWIFDIYYDWMYQVYCVLGVFLFIGYLLFDTSRVVLRIPEDEYILAAVTIYLDILNLFLFLLALLKK